MFCQEYSMLHNQKRSKRESFHYLQLHFLLHEKRNGCMPSSTQSLRNRSLRQTLRHFKCLIKLSLPRRYQTDGFPLFPKKLLFQIIDNMTTYRKFITGLSQYTEFSFAMFCSSGKALSLPSPQKSEIIILYKNRLFSAGLRSPNLASQTALTSHSRTARLLQQ